MDLSLSLSPGFFFGTGLFFSCSFFLLSFSPCVFSVHWRQWDEGGLNAMWGGTMVCRGMALWRCFFSLMESIWTSALEDFIKAGGLDGVMATFSIY